MDLAVIGFPCKAFSAMNPNRWDPNNDPFQHPQTRPFIVLSRWLQQAANPPSIVILENVAGILRKGSNKTAPIDVIMNGKVRNAQGVQVPIGLKYVVCSVFAADGSMREGRRFQRLRTSFRIVFVQAERNLAFPAQANPNPGNCAVTLPRRSATTADRRPCRRPTTTDYP